MSSPSVAPLSADPRVEDFLQDKFQTLSDIDSLDSLLASAQEQQQQLRSQLVTATTTSATARERLNEHSNALETAVRNFRAQQADIDRRLRATTSAETATAAAESFASSIEKLRRLDVARGYIALLQELQALSTSAREKVDAGDPEGALVPYTKLQSLSQGLKIRHRATEEAAVHLVEYVESTVGGLWKDMKKRLSTELEEVLKQLEWPKEEVNMAGKEKAFRQAFDKLFVLQGPELEQRKDVVLVPFQVLVRPLALRFRYHFEGQRQTNRVDKPEWFLSHITTLVTSYSRFMLDHVQPILAQSSNPNINQRDAINEFITALLPELRRKIHNLLPDIMDQAQLLSHFIHEMITFDATLREDFAYMPYGYEGPWKGMTHEVLVVENGFTGWLKVEKEFALARYDAIIAAPDAWQIDYESVDPDNCKPTRSAMRLKDLLETITDTYRPLISFSQRLRFLMDIQIAILDQYHDRLAGSIEAFRVLSSTIARAVQGSTKEDVDSLSGLGGLERLCRVYGSSMYLEDTMHDWNDDIFFLELWEDLTTRANSANPSSTSITGTSTSLQEVANRTSANLPEDGALFDETANSYARLRARTEGTIIDLFSDTVISDLRAYTRVDHWASTSVGGSGGGSINDPTALTLTPELELPLTTLTNFVSFLSRALARRMVKRITRAVISRLSSHIHDHVITRHQFSSPGALQLRRDVEEIWRAAAAASNGMVDEAVARDAWGASGLESLRLLTLDVAELRVVVKRVMVGGEEARKCVQELGAMEMGLEVRDVRDLVGRRVDAWHSTS